VAEAIRFYLGRADLLDDDACRCSPDRYVRHLLHAGTDYTILAIVWRPRQMSPVHGHRTWCALGLHRVSMVETFFTPAAHGAVPAMSVQRRAGDVSHDAADPASAHRLANLGTQTAISIHVYGAPYDRLGNDVNTIWAD
jgi:predicted metal-dependent enzyme (double-stranded beta helix superfamily)